MNLPSLWQSLERDSQPGYVTRRVSETSPALDLRLAVIAPGNRRALLMRIRTPSPDLSNLRDSEGFSVAAKSLPDEQPDSTTLELQLRSPVYADIFDALITAIVERIGPVEVETEAIGLFLEEIARWQQFVARTAADGLSRSEQIGLYGELWVLRFLVSEALGTAAAIAAWSGPHRTNQDFQHRGVAVEVKSSTARQPKAIRITSERQLDTVGTNALYLVHVSLDERRGSGESLPLMVTAVRSMAREIHQSERLEALLFENGYVDAHAARYAEPGYTIRAHDVFHVREGFPRIVEADLNPGIGDVHYAIELSACQPFAVNATTLGDALGAPSS